MKKIGMKFKPWMFRTMINDAVKEVSCLLKNQNIDGDVIARWENYGKTRMLRRTIEVNVSRNC
jgi:hypothetical protein